MTQWFAKLVSADGMLTKEMLVGDMGFGGPPLGEIVTMIQEKVCMDRPPSDVIKTRTYRRGSRVGPVTYEYNEVVESRIDDCEWRRVGDQLHDAIAREGVLQKRLNDVREILKGGIGLETLERAKSVVAQLSARTEERDNMSRRSSMWEGVAGDRLALLETMEKDLRAANAKVQDLEERARSPFEKMVQSAYQEWRDFLKEEGCPDNVVTVSFVKERVAQLRKDLAYWKANADALREKLNKVWCAARDAITS